MNPLLCISLSVCLKLSSTYLLFHLSHILSPPRPISPFLPPSSSLLPVRRLKGLEQMTKATMLGHLLPVLLTSLMHPNLQTLNLADALLPQLVQLVLYTSQVGAPNQSHLNADILLWFRTCGRHL